MGAPPDSVPSDRRVDAADGASAPGDSARSAAGGVASGGERPPGSQPFDALDAVAIPFRVAVYPLRLVWEGAAWGVGQVTGVGPPSPVMKAYRDVAEWGLALQFTSFGERSGPAAGIRLSRFSPLLVESAFSIRGSQQHAVGIRGEMEPGSGWLTAMFRRDAEANFWGIGPGSREEDRSDFRQDRFELDAGVRLPRPGPLAVELGGGYENTSVARGFDGSRPDLQDVFDPADVFGADERTEFVRVGVSAELNLRERRGLQWRGVRLRGQGTLFRGVSQTRADFRRLRGVVDGYLPLNRRQSLAAHVFLESNRESAGRGVPFTHLATVGSKEAGRGLTTGRFRDRDALGLMAEWRYEVWRQHMDESRAEWFLFVDQGTVAHELSALGDERWVTSYGFGLRIVDRRDLVGMGAVAFGEEGHKLRLRGEWIY